MADTRAAKIPSPAHRETALCRVLPFVKKNCRVQCKVGCSRAPVAPSGCLHQLPRAPLPPYLPTCLPACLPHRPWLTFCKSGGHQVSGAEPAESLKVLDTSRQTFDAGRDWRGYDSLLTLDGQT